MKRVSHWEFLIEDFHLRDIEDTAFVHPALSACCSPANRFSRQKVWQR
jgi:hypothetical protein